MSIDRRFDRLMPALTGRERALLVVLKAFKEGGRHDRTLAYGMNRAESEEYSRLMRLLNVCNTELVSLILAIKLSIDMLNIRLAWLLNVSMWELQAGMVERYLAECTTE